MNGLVVLFKHYIHGRPTQQAEIISKNKVNMCEIYDIHLTFYIKYQLPLVTLNSIVYVLFQNNVISFPTIILKVHFWKSHTTRMQKSDTAPPVLAIRDISGENSEVALLLSRFVLLTEDKAKCVCLIDLTYKGSM